LHGQFLLHQLRDGAPAMIGGTSVTVRRSITGVLDERRLEISEAV
jgi:hypothetical protein